MPLVKKGTDASKALAWHPAAFPLQATAVAAGGVYELPKKGGVPPPPRSTHHPLTKRELLQDDGRNTYESSPSRQNVAAVRQPRKRSGPIRSPHDAFTPFGRDELMFAPLHSAPPSVEVRIEKGGVAPPLKVLETWFVCEIGL